MIYKTKRCKLYFHYNHGQGHMLLLTVYLTSISYSTIWFTRSYAFKKNTPEEDSSDVG